MKGRRARLTIAAAFALLGLLVLVTGLGGYALRYPWLSVGQVLRARWPRVVGGGGLIAWGVAFLWIGRPRRPGYKINSRHAQKSKPRRHDTNGARV